MAVDGTDHDSPTLDQARRQLEHYGLGSDPQAVLVAVRLISAGARLGRANRGSLREVWTVDRPLPTACGSGRPRRGEISLATGR